MLSPHSESAAVAQASVTVLAELAKNVSAKHRAVVAAIGSALSPAMDAGDSLITARGRIATGRWESWLRTSCGISPRTARNYISLAEARSKIEANRHGHAELTIQKALRLIGREPGGQRKPRPIPALSSASWRAASPDERSTFVQAVGVDELLAALPEQSPKNDTKLRMSDAHLRAICGSLKLALGTTDDNEALAALRAVNRVLASAGRDFHNLLAALDLKVAKSKRR